MENVVFLNKETVTSQDLSHNAILAYVGLRMIMSRDVSLFGGESTIAPVSLARIAYELNESDNVEKSLMDAIKSGLTELEKNHWITLKDFYKEYLVDFSKLKIDTSKEFFIRVENSEIKVIMSSGEQTRKKIPLLRYFLALISTFNHSDYMGEMSGKVGGMAMDYIAKQACVDSIRTCIRYNQALENLYLIYVYRSNDKIKFDNGLKQINNCYSRYKDKELCIKFATDYEGMYGYDHTIIKTKKRKDEADNNRRLAAYYNQICVGTIYPIETVRQIKKYIHNKNEYLRSEIDNECKKKCMSYSDKEYVEKLKFQLRDEAPIDKLLESLESKEGQWGETDPLDESEDLFEEEIVFGKPDTISA